MMSYLEKFKDWKQAPATSVQYDKLVEESNVSSRTSNDMSHVHSPILDAFRPQKKRRNWMCAGVGLGLVDLVSILHAQLAVLAKVGHQQNGVVDVNRHKGEGPSGHWRKPGQVVGQIRTHQALRLHCRRSQSSQLCLLPGARCLARHGVLR